MFLFPPPSQQRSLEAVASLGENGSVHFEEVNVALVEGDPASVASGTFRFSVLSPECTICRCLAQRHRCVNNPVFTASTEAFNLG